MSNSSSQGRGVFIGLRKDQLGARLLMMLNCIRLAEDYSTDFRINWSPRGDLAPKLANPSDLFHDEFIAQHFINNDSFEAVDDITAPLWKFVNDKTPEQLEAHLAGGGHVLLDEGFEVVVLPWEDGDKLNSRFQNYISRIRFSPVVQEQMDLIRNAMNESRNTIAYHIRRGDILNEAPWKHKEWRAKIEPDELYSAYMKKYPDAMALMFSDQAESIDRFKAAHPGVRGIDNIADLSYCKPVQRDFLELYAMSRASEIVAPSISAFSRAAARISGQERVRFYTALSQEEVDAAYEEAASRLKSGVDKFITPSEAAQIFAKISRWLQESGREEEAWEIGKSILGAGADNAFLPLIQAINGIYLCKWEEARDYIDKALKSQHLWTENYAAALAIKAHIIGALGRRKRARRAFLRAFWQKPALPDIRIVGTYMIRRGRLKSGATLPFDEETVRELPIAYLWSDVLLAQRRIFKRRALDLNCIVIEWPWFAIDGKTRRILESQHDLQQMRDTLMLEKRGGREPGTGAYGFCALLDARMGRVDEAMERNAKAIDARPEDGLLRKRQAEFLMMKGDYTAALDEMNQCMALAPDHAFWHFLTGLIHETAGDRGAARACYETASAMDDSTAELHARLADLCREQGDNEAAVAALNLAAEIAPNQQKYRNRRDRLVKKRA